MFCDPLSNMNTFGNKVYFFIDKYNFQGTKTNSSSAGNKLVVIMTPMSLKIEGTLSTIVFTP